MPTRRGGHTRKTITGSKPLESFLDKVGGQSQRGAGRHGRPAECRLRATARHWANQWLPLPKDGAYGAEVRASGKRRLQTLPLGTREGHLCRAVPCPFCQLRPCPLYLSSTQLSVPVASACRASTVTHTYRHQTDSLSFTYPGRILKDYFYAPHYRIPFFLPCKVFIGTLNPLFHTCVYTVYIYSIFLVVEYCIWVCILWHCNHIFPLGSLSCPIGKKRKDLT